MAKYTMLLNDYVRQGFSLPSFDAISGFKDIFFAHYCDREIGFDTPQLFEIKLDARAALVLPYYAKKIELETKYLALLKAPIKSRYYEEDITNDLGAQHSETTALPFNATTAKPTSLSDIDARRDSNKREGSEREEGVNNVNDIINALNYKVNMILQDLLKEFNDLFMGVY